MHELLQQNGNFHVVPEQAQRRNAIRVTSRPSGDQNSCSEPRNFESLHLHRLWISGNSEQVSCSCGYQNVTHEATI